MTPWREVSVPILSHGFSRRLLPEVGLFRHLYVNVIVSGRKVAEYKPEQAKK